MPADMQPPLVPKFSVEAADWAMAASVHVFCTFATKDYQTVLISSPSLRVLT